LRNKGFLREILKNGVVGGSKKVDFIGLIRFWAKNEGKNEQKLVRNQQKRARFEQKLTEISMF
jgi:hypothetical protein